MPFKQFRGLLILIVILFVTAACSQPDFVTDKSDNITLVETPPPPETVTLVDQTQVTEPGMEFSSRWYLLIEDDGHHTLYEAQLTPEDNLVCGYFPLFTFPHDIQPQYIDFSTSTSHLLVQTETTLYSLNPALADLQEIGPIPEPLSGKVLQSPYQYDHFFYTLPDAENQLHYLVDRPYTNSPVMDLVEVGTETLLDVSEDASTFFFMDEEGIICRDIARNNEILLPLDQINTYTVGFGDKIGSVHLVDLRELPTASTETPEETVFDVVIHDGIIFEPETQTIMYGYDIGITEDTIVRIDSADLQGETLIDAHGLVVSPGFIDMLSFNPNYIGAKYKIGDGVTTNLSMHGCTNNFDDFFSYYERNPVMVNYGGAVFMYLVRLEAGLGRYTNPTADQVAFIAQRTREEIEAGGLALAFSPEYYPGTNSEEIKASMAIAVEYDLASHFHARYSSLTGEKTSIDSVIEVLDYARELDAHVHFMHLHSTGGTGCMTEALEMIREARTDGYEVTLDIYPYDSWATNIGSARFDGDWQNQFGISYEDLQIAGTDQFVTPENFQRLRDEQRIVVAYAMDNEEVILALQDPQSMIGSDSIVTSDPSYNHFRASGAFTRFLGHYVRDLDIMPLMEGIRKTSFYAAHQLEDISEDMAVRGRLTEGTIADITVFDYGEIIDTSSAEVPASLAEGVEYVLVSGQVVKDPDKIYTDRRYGQPIANNLRVE